MNACDSLRLYLSLLNELDGNDLISYMKDLGTLKLKLGLDNYYNCNDILNYLLQGCDFEDEIILLTAEYFYDKEDCGPGECYNLSGKLANKLIKYGINAERVGGYFQLNEINKWKSDLDEIDSRFLYHNDILRPIHHWVKIYKDDGSYKILDLTSDQFNNELYEELPKTGSCYSKNKLVVYDYPNKLWNYHELTLHELLDNDSYRYNSDEDLSDND